MRGSRANLTIRQGTAEAYRAALTIEPADGADRRRSPARSSERCRGSGDVSRRRRQRARHGMGGGRARRRTTSATRPISARSPRSSCATWRTARCRRGRCRTCWPSTARRRGARAGEAMIRPPPEEPPMNPVPVVLVTGASRGLGRGIAIEAAAQGLSVAINFASNAAAADETVELCERAAAGPGPDVRPRPGRRRTPRGPRGDSRADARRLRPARRAGQQRRHRAAGARGPDGDQRGVVRGGPAHQPPGAVLPHAGGREPLAGQAPCAGAPGRVQDRLRHVHLGRHRVGQPRRVLHLEGRAGDDLAAVGGAARRRRRAGATSCVPGSWRPT